jgi:hypothetical protein
MDGSGMRKTRIGFIYRITHQDVKSGINRWPDRCYIGQSYDSRSNRWNRHKRDARKWQGESKWDSESKNARLHAAMNIEGIANFRMEVLETIECATKAELISRLDEREAHFIAKYDSVNEETGWNKIAAPRKRLPVDEGLSLSEFARQENVHPNSLRHRVGNLNESWQQAAEHLREQKQEAKLVYEYGRQYFSTCAEIEDSFYNKAKLDKKNFQSRIRARKKGKNVLKTSFDSELNLNITHLDEAIFQPLKKQTIHCVTAPDGEEYEGLADSLFDRLRPKFPDVVPESRNTVRARLKKPHWTPEQSFGFEYPPDLLPVKGLIEGEGYKWAFEKPSFIDQDGKPLPMHSRRLVFATQKEFCARYKLAEDLVSDRLARGMSAEEILADLGLNP